MLKTLHDLVAPHTLQLVMFDLDGTLVDSVADLHLALDAMYDELGMARASEQQVRNWVGNGAQMLVRRALCYGMDVPSDMPLFERAFGCFLASYESFNGQSSVVYPGALGLIESLRANGIKCAVVTNKPAQFTLPLLEYLGLATDYVLSGDSLPEKKPHPMPVLACLSHFGCSPDASLMVGDSRNDILAAHSAGVKCVAVNYGYNHGAPIKADKPDLIVDSLDELR